MASIGLYDADFMKYTHVPFNLEVMKLATYWKRKRIITVLSPSLEPERYSTFIYRKDYNDGDFPREIFTTKNVIYGGYAFNNGVYDPLEEQVELCVPDKQIYTKFSKNFCNTKDHTSIFRSMLNAEHVRLSMDGKTIWKDFNKPLSRDKKTYCYLFHDYDLSQIDGAKDVIKDLINENPKPLGMYIGTKFPIQVYNKEELFKWVDFQYMYNNFSIQYNGLMDDDIFCELISQQKGTSFARQLTYLVTYGCSSENDFIVNRLPRIFKQAIFSRINRVKISLRYEDNFFVEKKWERLIQLINAFVANIFNIRLSEEMLMRRAIEVESLYTFARSFEERPLFKNRTFSRQEVIDIFQFVRETNYNVFKNFYDMSKVKLVGGKLVNDTTRYQE